MKGHQLNRRAIFDTGPTAGVITGSGSLAALRAALSGTGNVLDLTDVLFTPPGGLSAIDATAPYDTRAGIRFDNDGVLFLLANPGLYTTYTQYSDNYLDEQTTAQAANFWVRATLLSGSAPVVNAGLGAWLQLNAQRIWEYQRTIVGVTTGQIQFQIASDAAGASILADETITFTCNNTAI